MLERAQVTLIDDLHRLGRQLGVLKRLYQSYQLIVNRMVKRQRRLQEEKRNGNVQPQPPQPARARQLQDVIESGRNDGWRAITFDDWDPTAPSGVELCTAAAARFERLADRIGMYALSEIEECLTEKEGLTFLVSLDQQHHLCCCLLTRPGLQPHRHERLPSRRTPHARYNPPRQSHHPLYARQPGHGLLLHRGARAAELLRGSLLGDLRDRPIAVDYLAAGV